jgi:hypothetical protein
MTTKINIPDLSLKTITIVSNISLIREFLSPNHTTQRELRSLWNPSFAVLKAQLFPDPKNFSQASIE